MGAFSSDPEMKLIDVYVSLEEMVSSTASESTKLVDANASDNESKVEFVCGSFWGIVSPAESCKSPTARIKIDFMVVVVKDSINIDVKMMKKVRSSRGENLSNTAYSPPWSRKTAL